MKQPIAVTGVTGHLGAKVAARLADSGYPQRLVARRPEAAPDLPEADVVAADYADATAARKALDGVETLFMVSAKESADRVDVHRAFVDAAAAAGVRHIVYTSYYGAAPDAVFTLARDHWATEEHIRASGMQWTFLRDNLYLDVVPMFGGPEGVIRGPAANGEFSPVAQDDIADVAVAVLTNPSEHAGKVYDLTGPEQLSLEAAAATMTELTGRQFHYVDETVAEAYASRASYGAPDWEVDAWVSTYLAIAAGEMAGVSDCVERIAGHRPMSLRELLSRSR
jgi:uncharacterized protein YbjT (DUF2867 family)